MKKTYVNPKLEIVKLGTQSFLAASKMDVTNETTNTLDASRYYDEDEDDEDW